MLLNISVVPALISVWPNKKGPKGPNKFSPWSLVLVCLGGHFPCHPYPSFSPLWFSRWHCKLQLHVLVKNRKICGSQMDKFLWDIWAVCVTSMAQQVDAAPEVAGIYWLRENPLLASAQPVYCSTMSNVFLFFSRHIMSNPSVAPVFPWHLLLLWSAGGRKLLLSNPHGYFWIVLYEFTKVWHDVKSMSGLVEFL